MYIWLDLVFLMLLSGAAIMLVRSGRLLNTIILSSVFSLLCAFVYLLMSAPDVALTEVAIGACLTTCIFLAALRYIQDEEIKINTDIITLLVCIVFAITLSYFLKDFHQYGVESSVTHGGAVEYYKQHFALDTGLLSMVNSILASYRGFDTFGETLVIFIAGLCVAMVFEIKHKVRK